MLYYTILNYFEGRRQPAGGDVAGHGHGVDAAAADLP